MTTDPTTAQPSDDGDGQSQPETTSNSVPATPAEAGGGAQRMREAYRGAKDSPNALTEEKLWAGGYSSKAMIGNWLLATFVTFATLIGVFLLGAGNGLYWAIWAGLNVLIWVGLAMCYLYRKWTVKYELTTRRFVHESGLLKRFTDRIEVIDIDDVQFEQRLIERFIGVGTINISSSDRSHPELKMIGIDNVRQIADLIDNTRRAERERRGVFVESV